MYLRELTVSPDHLKGAGPAAIKALAKAGVTGVGGLLSYYPRDWEDRTRRVPLKDFGRSPTVCTVVKVIAHDWFGFGKGKTLKVHVEDESGLSWSIPTLRPAPKMRPRPPPAGASPRTGSGGSR